MPLNDYQFDGNAQKMSLYGKVTNPGDTAVNVDSVGALAVNTGALSASLDSVVANLGIADTVGVTGVSTTNTGVVTSYTVPANCYAYVSAMNIINLLGSTATVRMRYTNPGGTQFILSQDALGTTTQLAKTPQIYLAAGAVMDWFVSTAATGGVVAATISALRTPIF